MSRITDIRFSPWLKKLRRPTKCRALNIERQPDLPLTIRDDDCHNINSSIADYYFTRNPSKYCQNSDEVRRFFIFHFLKYNFQTNLEHEKYFRAGYLFSLLRP